MTAQHPLPPDASRMVAPKRTLVVTLTSEDKAKIVDLGEFGRRIADDVARHDGAGWQLVSTGVTTLRQSGTAGNMVFQSGGQFATMLGAVLIYQQDT